MYGIFYQYHKNKTNNSKCLLKTNKSKNGNIRGRNSRPNTYIIKNI